MYHEEWLMLVVKRLGGIATTITELGEGATLRHQLLGLASFTEAWRKWTEAETAEDRLAVAERAGL